MGLWAVCLTELMDLFFFFFRVGFLGLWISGLKWGCGWMVGSDRGVEGLGKVFGVGDGV